MMFRMDGFADAHLHLVDGDYPLAGKASLLMSCTSSPAQWEMQRIMADKDTRIFPFYGTHPWFCCSSDTEPSVSLREFLESQKRAGVGEIGLDSKHDSDTMQLKIFLEQMAVAEDMEKPAAIHMSGTEETVLKHVRAFNVRSMLHSYSGPAGYVRPFADAGCYFSVSLRTLSSKKSEKSVSVIPPERLLIESDAPSGLKHGSMEKLVSDLAAALDMDEEDIVKITRENAERFLS